MRPPGSRKKLLRLILWIAVGLFCLAGGCAACALLWKETDTTKAVILAAAAVLGGAGCLCSVFRFLRVSSRIVRRSRTVLLPEPASLKNL
jgi:hypothetical protein